MTPEIYESATEKFLEVAALPEGQRAEALDGTDPKVRVIVEGMLASDDSEDSEGLGFEDSRTSLLSVAADGVPADCDNYAEFEPIGSGGMGTVYRAQQRRPNRTVAIKVLRSDFTSEDMLRRFEREGELLGALEHRAIARVYEVGSIEGPFGQRPFIAMEWIDGRPIDRYASEEELGVRARLELLLELCHAVQHAHQKAIVHRDLKPDNILVDEHGQVKVLDFGIARVADDEQTLLTEAGALIGTLGYLSPERLSGGDDVDLRSDVYSIGVIGYELLTGCSPHDIAGLSWPEAIERIRVSTPGSMSEHNRQLAGDLSTIIGKALASDPDYRYGSAIELGQDIDRYLTFQPIHARPPSSLYLISCFARRNRGLVTAVSAAFLLLIAGLFGTLWMANEASNLAVEAQDERDFAREQTAVAEAINHFFNEDVLTDRKSRLKECTHSGLWNHSRVPRGAWGAR